VSRCRVACIRRRTSGFGASRAIRGPLTRSPPG
jgi:hypothetical protein